VRRCISENTKFCKYRYLENNRLRRGKKGKKSFFRTGNFLIKKKENDKDNILHILANIICKLGFNYLFSKLQNIISSQTSTKKATSATKKASR